MSTSPASRSTGAAATRKTVSRSSTRKLASPASHDGGGDYERNSDWGGAPPLVPESMGLGHADDEEDEVVAGLGRGEMSEF
jgi:hypothetical protein